MAEKSMLWATGTTGDGTTPYTELETTQMFRRLLIGEGRDRQGVLAGYLGQLEVSSGAVDQVTVATGGAVADGYQYANSTALNLAIARPSVGTTGGRINLRVDYTAKTVRAVVNRNTDGVSAIPALVQNSSFWDVPLATFTITTGGAVTLTDARYAARFQAGIPAWRQGGDPSSWFTVGTTNYLAKRPRVDVGAAAWAGAAAASGSLTITFAQPFAALPLLFATVVGAQADVVFSIDPDSTTGMIITWRTTSGTKTNISFMWQAWGESA